MAPAPCLALLLGASLVCLASSQQRENTTESSRWGAPLVGGECQSSLQASVVWHSCSVGEEFYPADMYITDPAALPAMGTRLCVHIRARALRCFRARTRLCSTRRKLLRLARKPGGLCGSRGFLPWVFQVSRKVSPVTYNMVFVPPSGVTTSCALGMTDARVDCTLLNWKSSHPEIKSDDIDDLQAKADIRMDHYTACLLDRFREAAAGGDRGGLGRCRDLGKRKAALVQAYTIHLFSHQLAYRIRPQQVQELLAALDE